ncbi:MAG: histidine phosphatase family protein [Actinomycetota bacterium]|nr:histidine phosphatase family protein [Actinomycetota bacterium]
MTGRPRAVLVRHGETEWSLSGQHTGRTDIPLTDEGRRRARALGTRLAEWTFARVLSSPLARALDTCGLAGLGDAVETTDDLREWDYGEYEGRRTVDIREERPGWALWMDGVPGGETVDDVGRRADRVIAAVRQAEGDVALFAHGHVLRVVGARWIGLPPDHGRLLALSTASISVLGWERETAVVERWNETTGE